MKFRVLPGVEASLDSKITESFKASLTTRSAYLKAKGDPSFSAKAQYEDSVIEYPDRVRIVSKTAYSYDGKDEYAAIFSSMEREDSATSAQIQAFIKSHKEYSKYSA